MTTLESPRMDLYKDGKAVGAAAILGPQWRWKYVRPGGGQKDRRKAPKNFFHVAPPVNFAGGANPNPIHYSVQLKLLVYIAPYIFYSLYVSL